MLKIRLQRLGRKKRPVYRVVVAEHSAPIKGLYVEAIGHYDPLKKDHAFSLDQEKLQFWTQRGAQPTNTIARLLKGMGVQGMDRYVVAMVDRKKKNPTEEEAAPAPAQGGATSQVMEASGEVGEAEPSA